MSGFAPRKRASGEKRTSTRDDALNLLSFKSRSVSNLRSALRRKGHSNDEIDEVVAEFLEKGYLNDLKTAEMWSESMMQTGNYGVNGIRTELVQKGIPADMASSCAEAAYEGFEELEVARKAVAKKFKGVDEKMEPREFEKFCGGVYRYLAHRGFSNDTVFRIINELRDKNQFS